MSMIENMLTGFCHNHQYCNYIEKYVASNNAEAYPAIHIHDSEYPYNVLSMFYTYLNHRGVSDILNIVDEIHVDTVDNGIIVYFKPSTDQFSTEEDVKHNAKIDFASFILGNIDLEPQHYHEKWLPKIIELVLEWLTLDGLPDALRVSQLPDEILEHLLKPFPQEKVDDIIDAIYKYYNDLYKTE